MKKNLFLCFIATLFIAGISSCSKPSTPNPNAQFVGTYYGIGNFAQSGSLTPYTDTFFITAVPSSTSGIIITGTVSNPYYLTATASGGNQYYLANNQSFAGGTTLTSGTGTLTGSSLSYNYAGTTSGSAFAFIGTDAKQ